MINKGQGAGTRRAPSTREDALGGLTGRAWADDQAVQIDVKKEEIIR